MADFRFKPELKAGNGGAGGKRKKHGADGADKLVKVPVGTVIYRDGKIIDELVVAGQRSVVAQGGEGGFGNAHFKSSVRQAPRVAELGEKGDKFTAQLELKMVADVGLVGFPNAGKSTFLSVVSNARPEIADYAFTTLRPNLGVADVDGQSMLIADIPGLIEGASQGKGLGDDFLRHVERTSVILHMIDSMSNDVVGDYRKIRHELQAYSDDLAAKPEVVALTKIDAADDEIVQMQINDLKSVTNSPIYAKEHRLAVMMKAEELGGTPTITLTSSEVDKTWWVSHQDDGSYLVTGPKIERFARRTDFDNEHGVNRLRDIMSKLGITGELVKQGATGDSVISIAGHEFTLVEQWDD